MTTTLTRKSLVGLLEPRQGPCLSFFFGTRRLGPESEQDRAHLKNLLAQAESALIEIGLRPVAARVLLQPVAELLEDAAFWQRPPGGTAIFLASPASRLINGVTIPVDGGYCAS